MTFHGERIEPAGEDARGDERLIVTGKLTLRGRPVAATLRLRVVERGPDCLIALGRVFVPYRQLRRGTGFTLPPTVPTRLLRLLVVVEFTPERRTPLESP